MSRIFVAPIIGQSAASGAQVIDGSLKFDENSKNYLTRTPSSAGNRKLWTWSSWLKFSDDGNQHIFTCNTSEPRNYIELYNRQIIVGGADYDATGSYFGVQTPGVLRDTGWYHVVVVMDTDQSTAGDRVKIYINGVLNVEASGDGDIGQGDQPQWNNTGIHYLGWNGTGSTWFNGQMSQCYLIDGQALGPEYFGFTDGLTNTWKPKKYVNTTASPGDAAGVVGFGTNGFYLPMDGSVPIGKDISGQGNDWTPKYFGGSLELDNPNVSGARPILNTTQGGAQAGIGVFGSKENKTYTVTYADDGGGNKYYIDGVKQATLTGLIRGATYTFNTVALGSTHPFRLSATSAHGTEYTNGVKAVTGAATTITIPHNSPDTLYYYCTAHSGMGSSITGITTNEKLADQYASNCVLAAPLVGSARDVSASIACTSTTKTVTVTNNAAAANESSNFYSGSFEFDGTDDDVRYASPGAIGTADFTLECWVNPDIDNANQATVDTRDDSNNNGTGFSLRDNGTVRMFDGTALLGSGGPYTAGKWMHLAGSRSGTSLKFFINGVLTDEVTNSTNFTNDRLLVGVIGSNTEDLNGYVQDVRLYRGVAKYTSDFVVPSRSPDILPDTPSGVSNSSKLTKITDGAVSFDGSGDYLTLADSADFDFGTGDYTAEAYFYPKSHADMYIINQTTDHGGAAPWWGLNVWSNGSSFTVRAGRTDASGNAKHEITYRWSTYKWTHIAVSRVSGTSRLYIDGVLESTVSDSDDIDGNGSLYVGAYNDGSLAWNGFISNVRIVKGTGVYTEPRITPPTAPLTNVTNTKLLCCQSTTDRTAAVVKPGSITGNGNAAATNFNPFNTDINTVRGQESGYATLNPLSTGEATLSDGNLDYSSSSNMHTVTSTISVSSGKWYWENIRQPGGTHYYVGIADVDTNVYGNWTGSNSGYSWSVNTGGNIAHNNAEGGALGSVESISSTGTVVGWALDMDEGTLVIYKNGKPVIPSSISSPNPKNANSIVSTTDLAGRRISPAHGHSSHRNMRYNFGQKPFKFPPPDGFQPLNLANTRPETVFSRPDQYVGISTWTGTGGLGTKVISHNFKFNPDFIWAKERNGGSSHALFDSVRGYGSNNVLCSNNKNPAGTSNGGYVNSVSTSTITWAQGSSTGEFYDASGKNYVAWCWRAGGDKNTFNKDDEGFASAAAAGLTAGTITPVGSSVGTKQGFSIIQYQGNGSSGAQVPHGLTQTPDFTIIRAIDDVTDDSWFVAGNWAPGYGRLLLHTGDADNGSPGNVVANELWNNTAPTSSVVTLGSYNGVNDSGDDFIMFNWHNVPGLQKFGTYTGKSALNYVELGFRPALIILKNQSNSSYTSYTYFAMFDSTRDTNNTMQNVIFAGKSQAENLRGNGSSMSSVADFSLDFLSNGFALRDNGASEINLNTNTYVYAAWAEAPTVDLYGGGANAR